MSKSNLTKSGIKIINARTKLGMPPLTPPGLINFLKRPELLVRFRTVDKKGEPDDVHRTWYYFDSLKDS